MREYQDSFKASPILKKPDKETSSLSSSAIQSEQVGGKDAAGQKNNKSGAAVGKSNRLGPAVAKSLMIQLQQRHGNFYVQRVVGLHRQADGEANVDSDVEQTIDRARGGGQSLDRNVSSNMGSAMNADFSGVRVHTGSEADSLNHSLSAKAFTTGQDVFFRQGEYNPGSSSGRALLAHELTHVVQQNPDKIQNKANGQNLLSRRPDGTEGTEQSIQTKLTVGNPGDVYEQEADRMSQAYTTWEQQGSESNDTTDTVNRQSVEEEEKKEPMVMGKQEPLQGKFTTSETPAQRQGDGGEPENRTRLTGFP